LYPGGLAQHTADKSLRAVNYTPQEVPFVRDLSVIYNNLKDLWLMENQNSSGTPTIFAKPFPDVSKIEVFSGQNFRRWQEHVSTLLDMYGVAMALSTSKPDESSAKQVEDWTYANKVCRNIT